MTEFRSMVTITLADVGNKIQYRQVGSEHSVEGYVTNIGSDLEYEHKSGFGHVVVSTYTQSVVIRTKDYYGSLCGDKSDSMRISNPKNWEFRVATTNTK